ncbi:hypothetical protein [Novosphingobium jiangmenense]|uniref:Uncharacterized protein n=1 Tax=Novosphingobium jiangmenense TaxID=2791981 RepID=A0ABS0HH68_9SPHN|nr:hypothetical protein [Novosphingobium jiangmenense]MBF9151604.1 hypothetical protein [Novosphingobium jiangmenense]
MARKVPASPARSDAALDLVLDRAPRPALPPGLAARIVAQATALPQLPAEPQAEAEQVAPREAAQVIPFAASAPVSVAPSRKRFAVGGFAAMAATVAAVILLGQSGQRTAPAGAPAGMMARKPPQAEQPEVAIPAAQPATQLAQVRVGRNSPEPAVAAKAATSPAAATPDPVTQPAVAPEAQLAATAPPAPRESAGPKVDPSPRAVPPRGLMGPPVPQQQGWGFSGGASGGTLPGGQSLPSQTTGTAPPPPAPSGN